jgi:hypothetical protein
VSLLSCQPTEDGGSILPDGIVGNSGLLTKKDASPLYSTAGCATMKLKRLWDAFTGVRVPMDSSQRWLTICSGWR